MGNKLLLVLAIGLALLALAAGSPEEENQVESFESDLARVAREADPGKGQRKVVKDKEKSKKTQKKKRNNKNAQRKKTRSNKKKGLKGKKGGKGQKQKEKTGKMV